MRFYTLPPSRIEYPYLMVNPRNYKELYRRKFEHAIFDCGVEVFNFDPNRKDYSEIFLAKWEIKAQQVTEICRGKVWATIPDYPDDYHPGQFGDNVSKTLKNIERFIVINGVNWLPVIQSRFLDIFSFHESCQRLKEIIGDFPRVAIGTVCKTNKLRFIERCCKVARNFFPKSHVHAFGLTLAALPRVIPALSSWDSCLFAGGCTNFWYRKNMQRWIDSFDSLAYTFPRERGKGSCKNLKEREMFFYAYLNRINQLLGLEPSNNTKSNY